MGIAVSDRPVEQVLPHTGAQPSDEWVAYADALEILQRATLGIWDGAPCALGQAWLGRAGVRLSASFDKYLRAGHTPVTSEHVALALLKTKDEQLRHHGDLLEELASALLAADKRQMALKAHLASQQAYEWAGT